MSEHRPTYPQPIEALAAEIDPTIMEVAIWAADKHEEQQLNREERIQQLAGMISAVYLMGYATGVRSTKVKHG